MCAILRQADAAQLVFHYSAMNAGKTTSLLQTDYNYREREKNTIIFIPSVDLHSWILLSSHFAYQSGFSGIRIRLGLLLILQMQCIDHQLAEIRFFAYGIHQCQPEFRIEDAQRDPGETGAGADVDQ